MFSQINTLRCNKLIYTIVKSKNCECSVSITIWKSAYWGPDWKLLYGQAKDPLSSFPNYYSANLYSTLILLMS